MPKGKPQTTSLNVDWFTTPPRQPKPAKPSATISASTIQLNAAAGELLGAAGQVALGIVELDGVKKIAMQTFSAKAHQDGFPVKTGKNGKTLSIRCGKFIQLKLAGELGIRIDPKKRMKCDVSAQDGLLIISI